MLFRSEFEALHGDGRTAAWRQFARFVRPRRQGAARQGIAALALDLLLQRAGAGGGLGLKGLVCQCDSKGKRNQQPMNRVVMELSNHGAGQGLQRLGRLC